MDDITINNKPLKEFLEKEKSDEAKESMRMETSRKLRGICKAPLRGRGDWTYDFEVGHGPVRRIKGVQLYREIGQMTETHKVVYDVLRVFPTPTATGELWALYKQAIKDREQTKHLPTFRGWLKEMFTLGIVDKYFLDDDGVTFVKLGPEDKDLEDEYRRRTKYWVLKDIDPKQVISSQDLKRKYQREKKQDIEIEKPMDLVHPSPKAKVKIETSTTKSCGTCGGLESIIKALSDSGASSIMLEISFHDKGKT